MSLQILSCWQMSVSICSGILHSRPKKGYVNIPVVGNYQASVAGNTAFGDIVVLKNDKYKFIFNKKVPASLALANLKEMNVTSTSMRVGAVNFGSYAKDNKSFWSFDMGARLDFDASLPYGFVDFLKNGNSVKANNLGYDIQSYCEMAFSYSLPVTEKLYVGARVQRGLTQSVSPKNARFLD